MDAATLNSRFPEFNLDPALAETLETAVADDIIEGILRLENPNEIPPHFRVVSRFNRICTGRFRAADTLAIRRHPNVISLKAARPVGVFYDDEELAASDLPRETGTQNGSTSLFGGRGCIVAALDFGLDFAHPNFVNPDSTTRLVAFWHQGAIYDAAYPNRYGYGRIFSREEIDAALRAPDPYLALDYHPAISDTGWGSHGTHTLDIAAGNGRVGRAGSGFKADLIFVHLSTPRLDAAGDLGDSVRMLEGLHYVDQTAGGRPWVVNLSVGRTAGSHDGTSLVEQGMHELMRLGPGRVIVQSAGNYRSADLAVQGWLRDGEHRELSWVIDPADTTDNEMDVWYSGKDRFVIAVRPPRGATFIDVTLGDVADIVHEGAVVGRIYHRRNDPNNRDNHADIFLYPGAPSGVWTLRLLGEYVISGRFHAWIERDLARPGAQSRFDAKITSRSYTLGTIATSPLVITVGAYDANAVGTPVAPFSSQGPTRDERRDKPELLAPGVDVIAARSIPFGARQQEGLLVARSGTSMAAPHVTGTVAAMFEAAGRPVSIDEIRDSLKRSALPLEGGEYEDCWGRLNIAEAIRFIRAGQHTELAFESVEAAVEESVDEGEPLKSSEIVHDLLDRAELALYRSNGRRQESEIAFVQQLLSELGGQLSGLGISPANLFRSAVREDSHMQGLGDLLRVVGAPLKRATDALQLGDWMVRVVPGTGDIGHVSVLASDDLMSRSQLQAEGIDAESSQPGYYGTVIESGAYPHSSIEPFARRFLDSSGRVPPHTVILRPRSADSDTTNEYALPAWLSEPVEDDIEPFRIEGGKYSRQEKQHAAEHRAGLIRTSSILGKQEQKLIGRAPPTLSVSKELMRFEAGQLGQFVFDWNDFAHYLDELLRGIGRLRDLLSAGAPQSPADMTAAQKRALRPTDDTPATGGIKVAYRAWRKSQARYLGLVFDVAEKRKAVELARQAFWEAKGRLSRTIAAAKNLNKPKYELELTLSDLFSLTNPWSALAAGVDKMMAARRARQDYDAKLQEFAAAVQNASEEMKDDFQAFRNAGSIYWDKHMAYRKANQDLDQVRIESREDAALVGQLTAGHSESRGKILAELRMPELVADAWHALASIGPPARKKLLSVLAARAVIEKASIKYDKWRNDPLKLEDITHIRLAWKGAKFWEPILTKEDVADWVAENKLWEETLGKFNV